MADVELFKGGALANSDKLKALQGADDNLLSGAATTRRISIRGSKFRQIVGGQEMAINKTGEMNVVILDAARLSRTFFDGAYDSEKVAPPKCWSHDTNVPAPEVPADQKQSKRCIDCPQNVKGSGPGQSRACRFGQRLAVAPEGELDTVYQMQLPATSIFGDPVGGKMPMQAYAKYLKAHSAPVSAVVTQMIFDDDSEVPKLFFKAVRPLNEDELDTVIAMRDTPEVKQAVTLTVSQTDGVQERQQAPAAPEPEAPQESAAEEPEVEEPKKASSGKKATTPAPAEEDDLSAIVDGWDD